MRKWIVLLMALFLLVPATAALADTSAGINQFKQSLNKQMIDSNHQYVKNTVSIVDAIELNGNVTKVLKADDPSTPENEENVEKYQTNLIAVLAEVKEERDGIFHFSKKALYYYDVDHDEFLKFGDVFENPEIDAFFNKNVGEVHKTFTVGTQILNLVLILSVFVLAYSIYIFHNENRTTQKIHYFEKYSTNN